LHVNSVDVSLEDVLQRFQEIDVSGSIEANEERNRQFAVEEFSTSFGYRFKVSWMIAERVDMNRGQGFTVGTADRSSINGVLRLESTGVLINNSGGYASGTTSFTVDGVDATTIFVTDNQPVYKKNGNKLGHIHLASVTTTTVVIKTPSVHAVANDEELVIVSTESNPEAIHNYLKIGSVHSRYLMNRRG